MDIVYIVYILFILYMLLILYRTVPYHSILIGPPTTKKCWKIFEETSGNYTAHRVFVAIGQKHELFAIGGSPQLEGVEHERDESIVEKLTLNDGGGDWVTCAPVPTISYYCEHGVACTPAAKTS